MYMLFYALRERWDSRKGRDGILGRVRQRRTDNSEYNCESDKPGSSGVCHLSLSFLEATSCPDRCEFNALHGIHPQTTWAR